MCQYPGVLNHQCTLKVYKCAHDFDSQKHEEADKDKPQYDPLENRDENLYHFPPLFAALLCLGRDPLVFQRCLAPAQPRRDEHEAAGAFRDIIFVLSQSLVVVDDDQEPMPFERFDPGFGFAPVERVCVRLRLLNELALYLV